MGSTSHLIPKTQLAHGLHTYFKALVDNRGWDASGRKMETEAAPDGPKRNVWAKLYSGIQAMNANEIEIAARIFEKTPYEFVTESRYFEGSLPVNVPGLGDDGSTLAPEVDKAIRKSDLALASLRGRNEAETQHID